MRGGGRYQLGGLLGGREPGLCNIASGGSALRGATVKGLDGGDMRG